MNVECSQGEGQFKEVRVGPRTYTIPRGWKISQLDEIANVEYGKSLPESDGEIPAVGSSGTYDTVGDSLIQQDTIVVGRKGSAGETYLVRGGCWPSDTTFYLTDFDSDSVDIDFLHYYMRYNSLAEEIEQTTLPSLDRNRLETYRVLIPSLPEQRRIADILSTVDKKIQQTDEMIEGTKELKRGLMQDLLIQGIGHDDYEEAYLGPRKIEIPSEWEKARLDEVSEIITRGKQPTYVEEGGVPVLNQSCIYWDGFHPNELKRLDADVAEDWKDKYWVKEGDVLINSTGKGTLGRALEWTNESGTYALDSHITRVHPDESLLDPTYFRFYLESTHGQKMLYAFCVAGSTGQIELSKTDLQTMPILLPPIEEQRDISEALTRVNNKSRDELEMKEYLQELKSGLMQDLLTGKVRVNTD